jgi:hypothetical protein
MVDTFHSRTRVELAALAAMALEVRDIAEAAHGQPIVPEAVELLAAHMASTIDALVGLTTGDTSERLLQVLAANSKTLTDCVIEIRVARRILTEAGAQSPDGKDQVERLRREEYKRLFGDPQPEIFKGQSFLLFPKAVPPS